TLIEALVSGVEPLKGFNSRNQAGEGIGIIGEVYYIPARYTPNYTRLFDSSAIGNWATLTELYATNYR
ncbi:MAG: hypothetical protein WCD53_17060, partial [Microcoleus sp.]